MTYLSPSYVCKRHPNTKKKRDRKREINHQYLNDSMSFSNLLKENVLGSRPSLYIYIIPIILNIRNVELMFNNASYLYRHCIQPLIKGFKLNS